MINFISKIPKVELHLHIEGTLEPELMFKLAKQNNIEIPYKTTDEIRAAYNFHNLQSFLDIYYQGANVLIKEQDFFDLTWEYMVACKRDNVIHTEIFFDPQTHTSRGIPFDVVVGGIDRALKKAQMMFGISSKLIMCFLRHLDERSAFEALNSAIAHKDKIIAVGLDSSELGHPPEKFRNVFQKAIEHGFLTVAHAGEEGSSQNISNSMELLKISRIDHGVKCVDDPILMEKLIKEQIPLTICPLSNTKLKVFNSMSEHNLVSLLRDGVCVTINSDDPAYFGGYMTDNFNAVAMAHKLTKKEISQFTSNAIKASFISDIEKTRLHNILNSYLNEQGVEKEKHLIPENVYS